MNRSNVVAYNHRDCLLLNHDLELKLELAHVRQSMSELCSVLT